MLKQKTGKSSSDGRARYRNRSGVVELVGKAPSMFARVENGVAKSLPKNQNRQNFGPETAVFNANGEFSYFLLRKTHFGGGYNFKIG
tara:strand:- start:1624 stop:1884 length:261 start_codon:yes stop_codon:yes gene_type:complete